MFTRMCECGVRIGGTLPAGYPPNVRVVSPTAVPGSLGARTRNAFGPGSFVAVMMGRSPKDGCVKTTKFPQSNLTPVLFTTVTVASGDSSMRWPTGSAGVTLRARTDGSTHKTAELVSTQPTMIRPVRGVVARKQ